MAAPSAVAKSKGSTVWQKWGYLRTGAVCTSGRPSTLKTTNTIYGNQAFLDVWPEELMRPNPHPCWFSILGCSRLPLCFADGNIIL